MPANNRNRERRRANRTRAASPRHLAPPYHDPHALERDGFTELVVRGWHDDEAARVASLGRWDVDANGWDVPPTPATIRSDRGEFDDLPPLLPPTPVQTPPPQITAPPPIPVEILNIQRALDLDPASKDAFLMTLLDRHQAAMINALIYETELAQLRRKMEEIREACSCLFCTEIAVDPVVTPCGHTFCAQCMFRWTAQYLPRERRHCPKCRDEYRGTVANFMIADMIEVLRS
jgi:hypothetical protein